MESTTIAALAATRPKLVYRNWRAAADRLAELQNALALPAGQPSWNITKINNRIVELEGLMAARSAAAAQHTAPPTVAAPPVAASASPLVEATKTGTITARCLAANAAKNSTHSSAAPEAVAPKKMTITERCIAANALKPRRG